MASVARYYFQTAERYNMALEFLAHKQLDELLRSVNEIREMVRQLRDEMRAARQPAPNVVTMPANALRHGNLWKIPG